MNSEVNFQVATTDLLKSLKNRKEALQTQYIALLAEIDKEIEAVAITARLLREAVDNPQTGEASKPYVIPNNLSGKSAREACIEIAKKNDGTVRVVDATRALVSAGILKQSKNTWAIVYTTLNRSKEFEKGRAAVTFKFIAGEDSPNQLGNLLQLQGNNSK